MCFIAEEGASRLASGQQGEHVTPNPAGRPFFFFFLVGFIPIFTIMFFIAGNFCHTASRELEERSILSPGAAVCQDMWSLAVWKLPSERRGGGKTYQPALIQTATPFSLDRKVNSEEEGEKTHQKPPAPPLSRFLSEKVAAVSGPWFYWNNIFCTLLLLWLCSCLTTGIIFSLCVEFGHFLWLKARPQADLDTLSLFAFCLPATQCSSFLGQEPSHVFTQKRK